MFWNIRRKITGLLYQERYLEKKKKKKIFFCFVTQLILLAHISTCRFNIFLLKINLGKPLAKKLLESA